MAKAVKPKDDNSYEWHFNLTYLDVEEIFESPGHSHWDINLDKKYNIYDPRVLLGPHTAEEFENYDRLSAEKQVEIHNTIAESLTRSITGTFSFLEHHYNKFETESHFLLYDPNEVTSPGFLAHYLKTKSNYKLIIVDPEFYKHEKFMEFYREHGSPKIIDKKPFLIFIKEMLPSYPEIPESRKQTILEWVNEKLVDLKNSVKPSPSNEKIKWNGSPSQFGFLISSLVKKGFIDPPLYNGETNFSGLARLCYDYFDIETTIGNLTKEVNPEKNSLSNTKRSKFDIPDLSDLA